MQSSEPMTMGSPPNYPLNPSVYHHTTAAIPRDQSPYLPAYLMGEPITMTASPSTRPWASGVGPSPPRSHHRRSMTSNAMPYGFNTSRHETRDNIANCGSSAAASTTKNKERAGAPPVFGLMESFTGDTSLPYRADELDCSSLNQSYQPSVSVLGAGRLSSGQTCRGDLTNCSNVMFNASSSHDQPPPCDAMSPAQIDPFYSQGESLCVDDVLDDTWVTVFGFPPATTSFILQEFSQYGNILKHVIAPNGNWLRIQYQSKLQAKKALSKNGKVFGGSIMVGVTPCIDKGVMCAPTLPATPRSALRNAAADSSTGRKPVGRSASMRPLTTAYRATGNDTQMSGRLAVPQKSNNVFSKAMEYVFGW